MATTTDSSAPTTYTLVEPVASDGGCTLHDPTTGTTYHVVDYADHVAREKLASRGIGATVRADLAPADPDGLDWIVTRLRPGALATPGALG